MSDNKEDRIRAKAYVLWEQEGRPDGEHDRHWREAVQSLEGDAENGAAASEGTTAAKAPKVAKPRAAKAADLGAASVAAPKAGKTKSTK